jgi:hypothetical protein
MLMDVVLHLKKLGQDVSPMEELEPSESKF